MVAHIAWHMAPTLDMVVEFKPSVICFEAEERQVTEIDGSRSIFHSADLR